MSEEQNLKLEDAYFAGTSVVFVKTVTDHIFISVNDEFGIGKNTIILKESNIPLIKKFLESWEDDD